MLTDNGQNFTTGICRFVDDLVGNPSENSKLYVPVKIGDLPTDFFALVDTGAPYCIFQAEILDALGYTYDPTCKVTVKTRFGDIKGSIEIIRLTLLAHKGDSLEVESAFLVPETMSASLPCNFIGYVGCLQRFCFAVDPSRNLFHFGKYPEI
jgi:hypothetical protein